MNTTDGGLHFQAGIDFSIWDKDTQRLRKEIQENMKFAYEQSGLLDESFNKIAGTASGVEKALSDAGISFEKLISGNMLETLKAANLEFGKTGAELRKAAGDADKFVTGMEEGLKRVIEYQQEVLEEISSMPAGDAKIAAFEEFAATTDKIQQSTIVIQQLRDFVNDVQEEAKSVSQRFNEARDQMERMVAAGEGGSDQYKELAAEAIKLKSAQEQVNKEIQAMTKPEGLESLISGMTFLTSSIGLAQGAYSLFGAESEKLNETMLRLQSLMSVTIGLQELQKQVAAGGALRINVLSKVQALWNTQLWGSVVAARALMITLTGGLAAAIIGIIYLLDKWDDKYGDLAREQSRLNKSIADNVAEPLLAYRKLQMQWNALGNDLQAKKKFISEHKEEFSKLGTEVTGVSDAENIFQSNSRAFVDAMMLRAEAAARASIAMEDFKKSIELEREYKRKNIDKNLTARELALRTVENGPGNVAARKRLQNEAENIRQTKQNALDGLAAVAELEKKAAAISSQAGFKKVSDKGKTSTSKTKKSDPATNPVVEEILPAGSVAEIQKRLSEIDEALSKATNKDVISALKEKRIATAKELAEAEKAIMIQSFDDQLATTKKQIELRDKLLQQGFSEEQVNKLFPAIKDTSYAKFLEETAAGLRKIMSSGNGNEETATNLDKVNQALDELHAREKYMDGINNSIQKLKQNFSGSELISELEKLKRLDVNTTEDERSNRNNAVNKAIQEAVVQQEQLFNDLLKQQQSYEEASLELEKKYADARQSIRNENDRKKLEEAYNTERSALDLSFFQKTELYAKAFGNLERVATKSLKRIKSELEKYLATHQNLKPDELKVIQEQIEKIENTLGDRNPLARITIAAENYRKKLDELKKAEKEHGKSSDQYKEKLVEVKLAFGELFTAAGEAGIAFIGIAKDLGAAVGGLSDAANQALTQVQNLMEGMINAVAGYFSGNYMQMISGIIQMIGAIVELTNGDMNRVETISAWQREVDKLSLAYERLQQIIEKTAGEDSIRNQRELIKNLQQQQKILQQMRNTELQKKNEDYDKVGDYTNQIEQINYQIEELVDSFQEMITTSDFRSLSEKLADSLTEAWASGEDAVSAYGKLVDDVMRAAVQNALRIKILEPVTQQIVDQLYNAMGYGGPADNAIIKQISDYESILAKLQNDLQNTTSSTSAYLIANEMKYYQEQIAKLKAQLAANQQNGQFDGLTDEERDEIKNLGIDAMNQYTAALQQYEELFGSASEQAQGLKGDIKGITEKTAGALESQINAMRVLQAENFNVTRNSLQQLTQIEVNTRNLVQIRKDISELNAKTKNKLAGIP